MFIFKKLKKEQSKEPVCVVSAALASDACCAPVQEPAQADLMALELPVDISSIHLPQLMELDKDDSGSASSSASSSTPQQQREGWVPAISDTRRHGTLLVDTINITAALVSGSADQSLTRSLSSAYTLNSSMDASNEIVSDASVETITPTSVSTPSPPSPLVSNVATAAPMMAIDTSDVPERVLVPNLHWHRPRFPRRHVASRENMLVIPLSSPPIHHEKAHAHSPPSPPASPEPTLAADAANATVKPPTERKVIKKPSKIARLRSPSREFPLSPSPTSPVVPVVPVAPVAHRTATVSVTGTSSNSKSRIPRRHSTSTSQLSAPTSPAPSTKQVKRRKKGTSIPYARQPKVVHA
ncbi:hypothetical protein BC940DRAFT_299989 [Gongronella butleri]|nr:hypothetical protein BC940DRAFT_299989 [Gongronella butleri]